MTTVRTAFLFILAAVAACTTAKSGKQDGSSTRAAATTDPAKPADGTATSGTVPTSNNGTPGTGSTPTSPPGGGVACGSKSCAPGEVCCNASCGICTPPDGVCTQQFCEPTQQGTAGTTGACKSDADCRLFSDYCTGCDCSSLAKSEKDPTCTGPGVRCLADPCGKKVAACEQGRCVAKPKP